VKAAHRCLNSTRRFWLSFALIIQTGCAARALDTNQVLNAWFAAQGGIKTWSADFVQTRTLKALTQPLSTSGRLWFAMPNRFRWELGVPAQTIALRRPTDLQVVYPRLKRVERYALEGQAAGSWKDMMTLLEAGFPRTRLDLETQFQLLSLAQTNSVYELRLKPRSELARRLVAEIKLALLTNDFTLEATELKLTDGSLLKNEFTNTRQNPPVDEALFDFKPGPDFKTVEPLKPFPHD
jgi:outer membrane lipoprotein carrier protein